MTKLCIYDLLATGEENALSRRQLAALLGISDRTVRYKIAAERRQGLLILSTTEGGGGYFKAANREELRRFVASMTSRGRETFAAVTAARKALAEMEDPAEREGAE